MLLNRVPRSSHLTCESVPLSPPPHSLPCCAYPAVPYRFSLHTYHAVALSLFDYHLPCCAIIAFRLITTYPAVPLSLFASHLPCCANIAFRLPVTLLCHYRFFALTLSYPAVPLSLFDYHLPCCAIIPRFDYHLPCRNLIFLRTYPAVTLFFFALTLLRLYPAFRLPLNYPSR